MGTVNITLTLALPEELAAKAESSGVLNTENVERWVVEEVARRERVDRFFSMLKELRAIEPALSQEEIDEEIRLYREEKRLLRSSQVP